MQNAGTKFAGRIVSDDKTARTVKNAAGEEARARMGSSQRHDGVMVSPGWTVTRSPSRWKAKLDVQDLIRLNAGEFFTAFRGDGAVSPVYIPTVRKLRQ